MKLFNDFGVRAWFGTLLILGSFWIISVGLWRGEVAFDLLLPMVSAWVSAIVVAYVVGRSNGPAP